MSPRKLAIISTHPIQYYAPVFRCLAGQPQIELKVFYTWSQSVAQKVFDPGFGTDVKWDLPLLDGYEYQFIPNVAKRPGPDHFSGIDTPTLVAEITAWRPDAILVYTWNSRSHLRALRHFKGRLPVLFRGDSTLIDARTWWRKVLRRSFLSWVYRHIDVAIAVGSNNRDYFLWCGVPMERIKVAPHSVDTARFAAAVTKHENRAAVWRRALGIRSDAIVVLFAGKLQKKKNPSLLLKVFAGLEDASHLIFVGNGELETQIRAEAATVKNVHFMPFQNQSVMPSVYRLADVFVLPSQGPEETWGLALNEAMASGRTVIASSKVGGARDLIQHGQNGWIFESGSDSSLELVLLEAMARGQSGLRAMGAMAQAEGRKWSTEESARLIALAVLECVGGEGARRP